MIRSFWREQAARSLVLLVLLAPLVAPAQALAREDATAVPEVAPEVTLDALLAYAADHAPALGVATRRQAYAAAARTEAEPLLRRNPTLELAAGPRLDGGGERGLDFVIAVSQPVEIAGERGLRKQAATRLGERLGAETTALRWEVRREIVLAYRAARVAKARVELARRVSAFAQEMSGIARRRLAVGDATSIDVRIAEADEAQSRHSQLLAEEEEYNQRLHLAEVSGWSLSAPLRVTGEIGHTGAIPPLASVLGTAKQQHPQARAGQAWVAETQVRAELAERQAWPSPVLGVQVAREGATSGSASTIVLGTLGIELPFWQRNQGERATSQVDEAVARAEQTAIDRALQAQVTRAHAGLVAAARRLELFGNDLSPRFEESLVLLRRGFEAGELPLSSVVLARERFFEAQSDALLAQADYYRAFSELEYAVGTPLSALGGEQ